MVYYSSSNQLSYWSFRGMLWYILFWDRFRLLCGLWQPS
jgi:hypothetical protein